MKRTTKWRLRWPLLLPALWLAVLGMTILLAHFVFGAGWERATGIAALIFGSILLNGLLATWEDEQPGGFNHPTPEQLRRPSAQQK